MKKLVSMLVIIAMMLVAVVAVIPVSAADTPEGDVISGYKDMIKMKANGSYYLEEDIEISTGFGSDFAGTFDGCGFTVTITGGGPLFKNIKGATVKNVTVAGDAVTKNSSVQFGGLAETIVDGTITNVTVDRDITYQGFDNFTSYVGGVAAQVGGKTTFTNVVNEGEILIASGGEKDKTYEKPEIGGLIGKTMSSADITLINCKNNASVTSTQTQVNVGGIIGFVESASVYFSNCENNADLMSKSDGNGGFVGMGGMIGRTNNKNSTDYTIILSGCKNTGNMREAPGTNANMLVGGMIGRLYSAPHVTINSCINEGEIATYEAATGTWSGVGGIVGGYITFGFKWDSLPSSESRIANCLNTGAITGGQPGGIIGGNFMQVTCKEMTVDVEYCLNTGDITALSTEKDNKAGGIVSGIAYGEGDLATLPHLSIKNCKNEGAVSNAKYAGGIVGGFIGTTASEVALKIENCANTGELSGAVVAGGIIGESDQPITINGCLNKGAVDATTAAAIAGVATSITAANNFYSGSAAGANGTAAADIDAKIAALNFRKAYNDMEIAIAIEKAEALFQIDYTEATWNTFKAKLDAAKAAIANFNNTQANVDAAEEALVDAMAGLVRKTPDFTAINAKLEEAKSKKRAEYNTTSYSYLSDAVAAAEADIARADVLQSELNAHIEAIDEAIKGLKKRGEVVTVPVNTGGWGGDLYGTETEAPTDAPTEAPTQAPTSTVAPVTEPVEEEGGCGGVIGGAAVALVAVAAIGAGIVLKKKED